MGEDVRPVIMVVEDDPASVYLMRHYAGKAGHRVVSLSSGKGALGLAPRERPEVVLLADPDTRDAAVAICLGQDDGLSISA
jgi:CheY-like chemotaxis protein